MKIEGNHQIFNKKQSMSDNGELMKKKNYVQHDVQLNQKNEKEKFPGEHKLIKAIEKSNKDLVLHNTSLKFSIHEKTKEIMVKIIDNDTEEIIKEIPSEKILDMVAAMMENIGLFVDKKA